jgi:hypothetical protein
MWECLRHDRPPEPGWWVEEFVRVVRPLDDMPYFPPLRHPPARLAGFRGTLCDQIEQHVWRAWMDGWTVRQACDPYGRGWGSGPFLFETVPSVLYVLMRHGHDFEAAVTHAVLDTRDNDSIAAIVGAVLGALHGKDAIPGRWVRGLSGRTRGADVEDDGQVFRLIEQARAAFGP